MTHRAERSSAHREIIPNLALVLHARAMRVEPDLSQLEYAEFCSSTTSACLTLEEFAHFNEYLHLQFPAQRFRVSPIVEKGTKLSALGMYPFPPPLFCKVVDLALLHTHHNVTFANCCPNDFTGETFSIRGARSIVTAPFTNETGDRDSILQYPGRLEYVFRASVEDGSGR